MRVNLTRPQITALISAAEATLAGDSDGDVEQKHWKPLRRASEALKQALGDETKRLADVAERTEHLMRHEEQQREDPEKLAESMARMDQIARILGGK